MYWVYHKVVTYIPYGRMDHTSEIRDTPYICMYYFIQPPLTSNKKYGSSHPHELYAHPILLITMALRRH